MVAAVLRMSMKAVMLISNGVDCRIMSYI